VKDVGFASSILQVWAPASVNKPSYSLESRDIDGAAVSLAAPRWPAAAQAL
jgi:hypothetical protein